MKKQMFNPVLPGWEYVAGCEAHTFGNRVYLYGGHDRFGGGEECMNDLVCWSAPVNNLKEWRCEGVIYKRESDPLNSDGALRLFSPDVCRGADGRYYMYYTLAYSSQIAVAVCDKPAGEYSYYGRVRFADGHVLSSRGGEPFAFDPAILRDEGKNYLYIGYCPYPPKNLVSPPRTYAYCWAYRLDDDMLTIAGEPVKIAPSFANSAGTGFEGHEFLRSPSVRRAGNKYCLIYTSRHGHELCCATADSPDGRFEFAGTVISNGDIGIDDIKDEADCNNYIGNNEGSIEKIGGKWYVFYTRHTNRNGCSRQVCAEPIAPPDVKVRQVGMTSCGLNDGALRGRGVFPAASACVLRSRSGTMRGEVPLRGIHPYIMQDGEDGQECGQYIANFRRCAVCGFKYFSPDGAKSIAVTVRGSGKGKLVASDGLNNLATVEVAPSQEWVKYSVPFSNPEGEFSMFFIFFGDGELDILSFELL